MKPLKKLAVVIWLMERFFVLILIDLSQRRVKLKTEHARVRTSQRGISEAAIAAAFRFGRHIHRTGKMFLFIQKKAVAGTEFARYAGTVVIASNDGAIITAYRNSKGLRAIMKKGKRSKK